MPKRVQALAYAGAAKWGARRARLTCCNRAASPKTQLWTCPGYKKPVMQPPGVLATCQPAAPCLDAQGAHLLGGLQQQRVDVAVAPLGRPGDHARLRARGHLRRRPRRSRQAQQARPLRAPGVYLLVRVPTVATNEG